MLVQGFDHFVVPVNDIVVAEDFIPRFGGKVGKALALMYARRAWDRIRLSPLRQNASVYIYKKKSGARRSRRKAHRLIRLQPPRKACRM
jgi:hypothetical protein